MAEEGGRKRKRGEGAVKPLTGYCAVAQTKTTQPQPQATSAVAIVVVVARGSLPCELFFTAPSCPPVSSPVPTQPQLNVDRDERRYLPAKHINLGNRRQET